MDQLKILIVDDDTMMAQTLANIFHLKGYHPVAVHSAADALAALDQANFDCVLTDIRMPDMDGVALFEEIRKRQLYMPVILMTAYAAEALVQKGLEAGVAGVLEKPLDLNRVLYVLSHLQKNMTITVAGGDPQFRQTLGVILSNGGFKVREVTDLPASAAALNDPSGIILLDAGTSLKDCSEVLRSVHAHAPQPPAGSHHGRRAGSGCCASIRAAVRRFYLSPQPPGCARSIAHHRCNPGAAHPLLAGESMIRCRSFDPAFRLPFHMVTRQEHDGF
jgi:DNA-binding NtrC family response regulator